MPATSRCNSGLSHQFYNLSAWRNETQTHRATATVDIRPLRKDARKQLQVQILPRSSL